MVNREWQDLDDKWNLLQNGRIESFTVSIENPMESFRSIGSDMSVYLPTGARNISFSINGHIVGHDIPNNTAKPATSLLQQPTKKRRQYKKRSYEIMVKHQDGHFTQETFTVPPRRKRIGRIIFNSKKKKWKK